MYYVPLSTVGKYVKIVNLILFLLWNKSIRRKSLVAFLIPWEPDLDNSFHPALADTHPDIYSDNSPACFRRTRHRDASLWIGRTHLHLCMSCCRYLAWIRPRRYTGSCPRCSRSGAGIGWGTLHTRWCPYRSAHGRCFGSRPCSGSWRSLVCCDIRRFENRSWKELINYSFQVSFLWNFE